MIRIRSIRVGGVGHDLLRGDPEIYLLFNFVQTCRKPFSKLRFRLRRMASEGSSDLALAATTPLLDCPVKTREVQTVRTGNAFLARLSTKKVVKYRPDEVIFSQGAPCNEVHYIEEGLVKLTTVSNRGRGAVLGMLGHGDFLGGECLSGESHHQSSAIALVPCSIAAIKRRTMLRLIEQDRTVAAHLIEFLLQRNRRIEEDLIDRVFNSSEKRLARTLLLLSEHGRRTESPYILERISQDTLADMVGTTRSRVNFFMNKFRKLGFIRYNGGLKVYSSLQSLLQD
jgi:CRP/FNR family transcriptional regulator, cyclic AMP receptor protein